MQLFNKMEVEQALNARFATPDFEEKVTVAVQQFLQTIEPLLKEERSPYMISFAKPVLEPWIGASM